MKVKILEEVGHVELEQRLNEFLTLAKYQKIHNIQYAVTSETEQDLGTYSAMIIYGGQTNDNK